MSSCSSVHDSRTLQIGGKLIIIAPFVQEPRAARQRNAWRRTTESTGTKQHEGGKGEKRR
jgi:hypothetical protein